MPHINYNKNTIEVRLHPLDRLGGVKFDEVIQETRTGAFSADANASLDIRGQSGFACSINLFHLARDSVQQKEHLIQIKTFHNGEASYEVMTRVSKLQHYHCYLLTPPTQNLGRHGTFRLELTSFEPMAVGQRVTEEMYTVEYSYRGTHDCRTRKADPRSNAVSYSSSVLKSMLLFEKCCKSMQNQPIPNSLSSRISGVETLEEQSKEASSQLLDNVQPYSVIRSHVQDTNDDHIEPSEVLEPIEVKFEGMFEAQEETPREDRPIRSLPLRVQGVAAQRRCTQEMYSASLPERAQLTAERPLEPNSFDPETLPIREPQRHRQTDPSTSFVSNSVIMEPHTPPGNPWHVSTSGDIGSTGNDSSQLDSISLSQMRPLDKGLQDSQEAGGTRRSATVEIEKVDKSISFKKGIVNPEDKALLKADNDDLKGMDYKTAKGMLQILVAKREEQERKVAVCSIEVEDKRVALEEATCLANTEVEILRKRKAREIDMENKVAKLAKISSSG